MHCIFRKRPIYCFLKVTTREYAAIVRKKLRHFFERKRIYGPVEYRKFKGQSEKVYRRRQKACVALAVISGILLFCGLLYLVYRFLAPKYMDEYDDFDDEEEFENEE